ncbi:hypothetical protein PQ455_12220 [Sphingomonas naphthae]|uniref:Uncharacterized protein n=1 Tax=Sphingomonas naphthae TaxID=1813468 RepID=A0ABY7THX8_9SPHN|nr:hypothetical protein [Sphingomonas naphthae]WCT72401.1 hypothetical protein PQ455_12220 [Sphingomonas naphthae]
MSHARPLPDAAVAPWPAQPAPIRHDDAPPPHGAATTDTVRTPDDSTPQTQANAARWAAAGVGIGIGSAALVAAFLYASKSKRKK